MSGQPTKRGNWGTWAVIDYPNRKIHDEDEIPLCSLHYKPNIAPLPDYICEFATHDTQYLCTNPKSIYYRKSCNNCVLKRKIVVLIGDHEFKTRQKLLNFLNKTLDKKKKKKKIQCVYSNKYLCRKTIPSETCFKERTQCSRFRASNETNILCVNYNATACNPCSLPQHETCNLSDLCDDYRRKPSEIQKRKASQAKYACVYKNGTKCSLEVKSCVNCDSCSRYRGRHESNSKCKYNFGVEHDKCALHHCRCKKFEKCNEFLRKPALIKTYDRVVIINKN